MLARPAVQFGLDDVGREQGETQDPADVGRVDLFGRGYFLDRPVDSGLERLAPLECPASALTIVLSPRDSDDTMVRRLRPP